MRAFARRRISDEFLLIFNSLPENVPQYARQKETIRSRMPALPSHWRLIQTNNRRRLYWWLTTLPKILYQNNPTLFHALDNVSIPPFHKPCPFVLTLHDIIPITHPEFCRYRDAIAAQLLIRHAVRKADAIVTDSIYSLHQIIERFPETQSRLHSIYPGIDRDRFKPACNRNTLSQKIAGRHSLYSPHYLLCVATLNPRRNLVRLIRAFSSYIHECGDRDVCLVIAGCRGWKDSDVFEMVKEKQLGERIHFLQSVTDEEVVELYRSSVAVVNVSLLEGFGLPVLEAMSCGTPVICSSTTSLGEIAGDAALLVDPLDESSIAEALSVVISQETIRTELIQKGLMRASDFHWDRTSEELYSIYKKFASD